MDNFYAGLDESLFERGKSNFEAEIEHNDDDDDDDDHDDDDWIHTFLSDDVPDEEVPEEEEVDVK